MYLALSIPAMILCCLPFGIVAIVLGVLAKTSWEAGHHRLAHGASDAAESWLVITAIGGLATYAAIFFY